MARRTAGGVDRLEPAHVHRHGRSASVWEPLMSTLVVAWVVFQVEVCSPEDDLALRLVSNGKIQPVPAPQSVG